MDFQRVDSVSLYVQNVWQSWHIKFAIIHTFKICVIHYTQNLPFMADFVCVMNDTNIEEKYLIK